MIQARYVLVFLLGSMAACARMAGGSADDKALMAQSIVQINTDINRGTGFVLMHTDNAGDRLVVATAAHVIADSSQITLLHEERLDNGEVFRTVYPDVQVLAVDFERDLAVLEVPHLPGKRLRPITLDPDQCGSAKRGWGYPATVFGATGQLGLAFQDLAPQGTVKLTAEERFGPESRVLAKNVISGVVFSPLQDHGNSGGPIFSDPGKVVAVATQRSMLQNQGAGVCSSELVHVLHDIKPHLITRDTANETLRRVFTGYLSAAEQDSAQTIRDFVPPSSIAQARSMFQSVLIGAALSPKASQDAVAMFDQAFPGALKNVADHGDACHNKTGEAAISCWMGLTTRPVALGLLRHLVGGAKISEIHVIDEPKRVANNPPEYNVTAQWTTSEGKIGTSIVRLRDEWGRLWVVPTDVQLVWKSTWEAWEKGGGKFIGNWRYIAPPCNGRYDLTISQKNNRFTATATGSLTSRGCTVVINSDYRVDRNENRISLQIVPGSVRVASGGRCGWSDDATIELEIRSDGRLHALTVNGQAQYAFCLAPDPLIFSRVRE